MEGLKEWAVGFLRHKDVFTKSIRSIEDRGDHLLVSYRDRSVRLIVTDSLQKRIGDPDGDTIIVCPNTRENLDALIHNWQMLKMNPNLTICFANPGSSTETRWIIRPFLHDKVADDDTLADGLRSLFETVEPVDA